MKKDSRLEIRISKLEKEHLKRRARQNNTDVTGYIMKLINQREILERIRDYKDETRNNDD